MEALTAVDTDFMTGSGSLGKFQSGQGTCGSVFESFISQKEEGFLFRLTDHVLECPWALNTVI